MFIRFRCPTCNHKVRACHTIGGKKCKCKCGALITIPTIDFPPSMADNVFTAFSSVNEKRPASPSKPPTDFRRGWLVGLTMMLGVVVIMLIIGITSASQHGGNSPAAEAPENQSFTKKEETVSANENKRSAPSAPQNPVPVAKPAAALPKPAPAANPQPEPAAPLAMMQQPLSLQEKKAEILGWHTTARLTVIGDGGKVEPLYLEKADLDAGVIFVVVKVRVPSKLLKGKVFQLPGSDVRLTAPKGKDYPAIGCSTHENHWYAPEKGEFTYMPLGEVVNQSWLFEARLGDLESGHVQLQLGDGLALPLLVGLRVKG